MDRGAADPGRSQKPPPYEDDNVIELKEEQQQKTTIKMRLLKIHNWKTSPQYVEFLLHNRKNLLGPELTEEVEAVKFF